MRSNSWAIDIYSIPEQASKARSTHHSRYCTLAFRDVLSPIEQVAPSPQQSCCHQRQYLHEKYQCQLLLFTWTGQLVRLMGKPLTADSWLPTICLAMKAAISVSMGWTCRAATAKLSINKRLINCNEKRHDKWNDCWIEHTYTHSCTFALCKHVGISVLIQLRHRRSPSYNFEISRTRSFTATLGYLLAANWMLSN